jgi:hypothetical protein
MDEMNCRDAENVEILFEKVYLTPRPPLHPMERGRQAAIRFSLRMEGGNSVNTMSEGDTIW